MRKAIYFDLDNTLVNRNKSISVYSEKLSDSFSDAFVGVTPEEIARVISSQDNGGYIPAESPYKTIKEAVANEIHKKFIRSDKVTVGDILEHWVHQFPQCAVPMNGANELIADLSEQGFHLGIISNGADKTRIATANALDSFGHIKQLVSSEAAGIRKPESKIFTESAIDFGFTPDQCWYIGDHPVNDIEGARKSGMKTIWLKGFHEWPLNMEEPYHSIDSLSEVLSLVVSKSNK